MGKRVLLVEDELGLRTTLGDRLRREGYQVEAAGDGASGFAMASARAYDIVVLDLTLPDMDGLEVCRDLRRQGIQAPVLMLTARGQTSDKVEGLRLGADDYLTKPFEMAELLARLEALLRRAAQPVHTGGSVIQFGPLRIDFLKTEVTREGAPVPLSAKEFQLLRYFIEHQGQTLSRERLLSEVWGYSTTPSTRTVDVHVAGLRQKLERDSKQPELILTVHGLGYKFTPPRP